jgi:putative ABC transport system permease protein
MFKYYLQLGLRSLRRNPVLTALMVMAIGFGVASSMTTYTVFRAMSGDPIPWKSSKLFVPQIDPWGPVHRLNDEPPGGMTYIDAVALMRDHRGHLQSALYPIAPTVYSDDSTQKVRSAPGHAVYGEFFLMLDVPFLFGSGWSAADDEQHARVVVIGKSLNQRLFGGTNSVGRAIRLDGHSYRISGVLNDWHPQPKFYDLANANAFGTADQVFLPFTTAIDEQLFTNGRFSCGDKDPDPGFAGALASSCAWIGYMVELDTTAQVSAYRTYLDDYARGQQALGRFGWAPDNRLRDLPAWLAFRQVVPSETKVSIVVALCLLLVCMVNTVGLLLAKFLRRSGEIGVRRALGASRLSIAAQFGIESGAIGLAGGVLGLLLTWLGVELMQGSLPKPIAALAHIDLTLLSETLLLAVAATVMAGLYPIWRAMYVRPSLQLKED